MNIAHQIIWLIILALPIACVSWTVTHEEIFAEPREYCKRCSVERKALFARKFFYVFTCEYCFSFYVTALFLYITKYQLLLFDWRGYVIAELSLVCISNVYMTIFFFLRTGIKKEGVEVKLEEKELNK